MYCTYDYYHNNSERLKNMTLLEVIFIAVALSMDAFGVSLGLAISDANVPNKKLKTKVIYLFGFFQFALAFIGGVLGFYFNKYIMIIPEKILGIIIAIVGLLMIYDGKKNDNSNVIVKNGVIIFLGISVSIDALAVGFTVLSEIKYIEVVLCYSIIIGLITSLLCAVSFIISKFLKKIHLVLKYSNYFGGIILIIIAIKTVFKL